MNLKKLKEIKIRMPRMSNTIHTLIFEVLYIFVLEIIFKIIFGSFAFDYTLIRIFSSSLIIGGAVTFITSKWKLARKILLNIFNFGITIYAWVQLGFMDFLGAFISLGSAEQGTKIIDFIGDFLVSINPLDYIVFIMFIISILYYVFESKILKDDYNRVINYKSAITIISILLYFAVSSLVFYMTVDMSFMQNKYQTVSNKDLLKYSSDPALSIKNFGVTTFLFLDVKSTIIPTEERVLSFDGNNTNEKEKNSLSREIDDTVWELVKEEETDSSFTTLNNYFMSREITDKNEYTGMFKDKNLIMIMLESVAYPVFLEEYKEYFPTLYKFQTEGISSINNYSPKNNCATGESEMTSVLSLYSIPTTCTVNTYKKNVYPEALLSMFNKNNYYTSAYHDYTDQYYSRSVFEKNFGAMKYYGVTDLGMSYNYLYKEWPSDVTFVKKALPKFIKEDRFASYMVSVTSHSPYMYSSEWGDEYVSLFKDLKLDTTTKRYLSKIKVVDLALTELLKELEEEGILDDTVIVLFGDHYPYALSSKQFASLVPYDVSINNEVDRTPFIIYNSKTDAKVIDKITSPLDYAPTILNLFGIDYDPRLYLGHDIFSTYEDYVIFPDNSWQTQSGFYNASKGVYIANENSDSEMSDEDIIKMNTMVSELRNMSALAIKKNYFNNLYQKIDKKTKQLEEEKEKEKEEKEEKKETEE